MSSLPKNFLNAVVALGIVMPGKLEPSWIGTGFIVGRKIVSDPRHSILYLVTNRHVFGSNSQMVLCINKMGGNGILLLPLSLIGNDGQPGYSVHRDSRIDIAVVELNAQAFVNAKSELNWFDIEDHALTLGQMRRTGVDEGCLVYAIGFPMGIVENDIKAPFLRLGCISRIEDAFRGLGDSSYFVDAQTFPGNSGGPIINRPETEAVTGTATNSSANLIGILSAYLPYKDVLVSRQTGETMMIHHENSGLTKVFPVDRIIEVIDQEFHRLRG